jgi:hypothetical protein
LIALKAQTAATSAASRALLPRRVPKSWLDERSTASSMVISRSSVNTFT